jgi:hypothetical protein
LLATSLLSATSRITTPFFTWTSMTWPPTCIKANALGGPNPALLPRSYRRDRPVRRRCPGLPFGVLSWRFHGKAAQRHAHCEPCKTCERRIFHSEGCAGSLVRDSRGKKALTAAIARIVQAERERASSQTAFYSRSKIPAAPMPPPMHMVTMPYRAFRRCNSRKIVAVSFAPVHPSG